MSSKMKVEKEDNVELEDVDQDYKPLSAQKFLQEESEEPETPATPQKPQKVFEGAKAEAVATPPKRVSRGRPRLTEEQKEEKRRLAREKAKITRAAKKAMISEEEKKKHAEEVKKIRYKNLMKAHEALATKLKASMEEKTKPEEKKTPLVVKSKKKDEEEDDGSAYDEDSDEELVIKKRNPRKKQLELKISELENEVKGLRPLQHPKDEKKEEKKEEKKASPAFAFTLPGLKRAIN